MEEQLEERFERGDARVAVMGLGYAGLPLAASFAAAGFRVLGFDTDPAKVRALEAREPYLSHLAARSVELVDSGRFEATSDPARLAAADAVFLCVPTPLDPERRPDLSFVRDSIEVLAAHLAPGRLVVLTSTTWPGTTREVLLPVLRRAGFEPGRDVLVAYSPEREDPGAARPALEVPRLVGGTCEASGRLAAQLLGRAYRAVVPVSRAEVAEAAKLHENVFRAVNIALVNELKDILEGLELDVWEVIEAAATKPYGFQRFDPGPGMGGHCIPIDPFYLAWVAERVGRDARFVELAGRINREMPERVVQRTLEALGRGGRGPQGARILVLGLAYKRDVGDVRESPAFPLMARFEELGAEVAYSDPHVPRAPAMREWGRVDKASLVLDAETLASFDACVLVTDHGAFDYERIAEHARLVVDTRGALRERMAGSPRYVQA